MALHVHLFLAVLAATLALAAPARRLQLLLKDELRSPGTSQSETEAALTPEHTIPVSTQNLPYIVKDPAAGSTGSTDADRVCFCTSGTVCCHTTTGLDCSAGYCGL